jgi:xanthine dehydrogenase accessory factor
MWDWISALHQLSQERRPFALVVVTKVAGSVPREPGAKMVVFEDGSFLGTVGGGHFEKLSIADAQACLRDGVARSFRYPLGPSAGQCCGGVVETFIEPHHRNPDIYVFGAGHVAQALARTLEGTPFRVTVIDERSEWVHAKGLGPAVQRCEGEWFDIAPN